MSAFFSGSQNIGVEIILAEEITVQCHKFLLAISLSLSLNMEFNVHGKMTPILMPSSVQQNQVILGFIRKWQRLQNITL